MYRVAAVGLHRDTIPWGPPALAGVFCVVAGVFWAAGVAAGSSCFCFLLAVGGWEGRGVEGWGRLAPVAGVGCCCYGGGKEEGEIERDQFRFASICIGKE